ncbi:DsbA family oxidoreductase [Pseudomonas sp. SP16.1]|uniref:DsbA family oxidoreductase n=1 Tax=Pseudomonas sp. SP16.1 TaxID=3458854 RepID=UPI004045E413
MSVSLKVDVFFDFICPWCLIGKRQLQRALRQLQGEQPGLRVEQHWHGVQLLPHLPVVGVPFAEFYQARLGSAQAVRMRQAQVQQAASAAGLDLDLSRIERMPNTADAHRLLACATALGDAAQGERLLERMFAAYFQRGEDLGDAATLLAIAEECGFEPVQLAPALLGNGLPYFPPATSERAPSVPHFVFNDSLEVSGAQPAEVLLATMQQALARQQERRA